MEPPNSQIYELISPLQLPPMGYLSVTTGRMLSGNQISSDERCEFSLESGGILVYASCKIFGFTEIVSLLQQNKTKKKLI